MLSHLFGVPQDALFPGVDLFHATEHLLPRLCRIRSVFTLHDLIFRIDPGAHLPLNRIYLNTMLPRFLRAADAVIAVSECTKRDAVRLYGTPSERIHVIPEGVEARFKPMTGQQVEPVSRKHSLPERFIVCVGTLEPRKNYPLLFEVLAARRQQGLDTWPIVIAGKPGWLYEPIFQRVTELGLQDLVHFTGFFPDNDLPALYSAATLLAMPSRYEGFGLPPLEAMACGAPVVTSNVSSLPEVVGDAALTVDPHEVDALAEAMRRMLSDAALRDAMVQRGLVQAQQFTWSKAAERLLCVYRELVSRPGRGGNGM